MNYSKSDKGSSTIIIRVMCATIFVLFTWGWLYFFQADALAMTQHVLSDGLTHYNRFVGALIITAILMILQYVINNTTKLNKRFHALTYMPSMLLLAMLTDISQTIDNGISISRSIWLVVVFAVIWGAMIFFVRQYENVDKEFHIPLFSRSMWMNLLMMSAMIICVGWIGNTNAVFQYRMKVEGHLMRGEYHQARKVGQKSLESDADLMMLRMYALARCMNIQLRVTVPRYCLLLVKPRCCSVRQTAFINLWEPVRLCQWNRIVISLCFSVVIL